MGVMPDTEKIVLFCVMLVFLWTLVSGSSIPSKSAGHICIETRTEFSSENVTENYSCLKNKTDICGWLFSSRDCVRLRQSNCSRTVLKLVPRNVTEYVCCSGWARDEQQRCLVPLCKGGCLNGGTCVNKDRSPTCECTEGYSGVQCDNRVDVCVSPDNPCDQVCVNTVTRYRCKCFDGYVLQADNKTCHKNNGTTPVPLPSTSDSRKPKISTTAVYIMVAIGAILILLLVTSTFYLLLRRKDRLAMESILKERVSHSVNDYSNPSFLRFSNEFVSIDRNPQLQRVQYSSGPPDDQTQPNRVPNAAVLAASLNTPNPNGVQFRVSNASSESLNSNGSTGWTNPMFLNAREPDNNRPATYAIVEEDIYSGSGPSAIYQSIPECVQP